MDEFEILCWGKVETNPFHSVLEEILSSPVLVQAIVTKSDRKVVSSADVMHIAAK